MAADIRRFLRDEPIVARPASTLYQIRKFAARNRVLVGGVAATFLALVAGIIATTRQSISATRARDEATHSRDEATKSRDEATKSRDEATQSRDEATRAAAEAKAINDFLVKDMLLGADPQQAKGRRITVEEVLGNASAKIDTAYEGQPLVAASIRGTLGRIYYASGGTSWRNRTCASPTTRTANSLARRTGRRSRRARPRARSSRGTSSTRPSRSCDSASSTASARTIRTGTCR
jgi:hypothetical protein